MAAERIKNPDLQTELNHEIAQLSIRLSALDSTALRLLTRFDRGEKIGAEPSMLKMKGSQLVQDMDRLLYELAGHYGLPLDSTLSGLDSPVAGEDFDMVASGMFHHRGYTLAGGTSEVQHNIIARQVLML